MVESVCKRGGGKVWVHAADFGGGGGVGGGGGGGFGGGGAAGELR